MQHTTIGNILLLACVQTNQTAQIFQILILICQRPCMGILKQTKPELFSMSHYVDANLMHNLMTGILHLVNKTLLERYFKKKPTVEKKPLVVLSLLDHKLVLNR
jgi:hypothetical protein